MSKNVATSSAFVAVSVVIPAYNEDSRISKTLEALLQQTTFPQEVIVVDNASTDNTPAVVRSFKEKFANVAVQLRLITEPKLGVARARNAGFLAAKSPVIASIDADSLPDPNWLEEWYHYMNTTKNVAATGFIIMNDAPWLIRFLTEHGAHSVCNHIFTFLGGFRPISTANAAIRKDAFEQVGGFDETISSPDGLDDVEISSRLALVGKIGYAPKAVVRSSLRRYNSPLQSMQTTLKRYIRLAEISRTYRKLQKET